MRFPVSNTGSLEEFNKDWYNAQVFGKGTSYGFHEGVDINKRTGGDTDLNAELKAIAKGKIVYYHNSHATTPNTFGRHLVYEIEGPWGKRWVHYAHCSDLDFKGEQINVEEGQIIARIGKSGSTVAHLHWAIYTVDPGTFGIDNIANTQEELLKYWEDPIAFVKKWIAVPVTPSSSISPSVSPSSSNSRSTSPSASVSPSVSSSASTSPSPSPSPEIDECEELEAKLRGLAFVIDGKWTWVGKNGWKNNLALLKKLLIA